MSPSAAPKPMSLVRNPLVRVRTVAEDGEPIEIDITSYTPARGFRRAVVKRNKPEPFRAAVAVLAAAPEAPPPALPMPASMALCQLGLLAFPGDLTAALPMPNAEQVGAFAGAGYADLRGCITPAMRQALIAHYEALLAEGMLRESDSQAQRYSVNNDGPARIVQKALAPLVSAYAGRPVRPSYTFASLYRGGAELPMHRDRPQCEYTLSLLMDHRPAPADGISPWPVLLDAGEDQPTPIFQALGGALLFRGREITHGRARLADDHRCWVLLLHYVDSDFAGVLD